MIFILIQSLIKGMKMIKTEVEKHVKKKIKYIVSMEIEAPFAMFARVDSGSEKTSSFFPPFSATKGIFESILYLQRAEVIPTQVDICKPIEFQPWTFNYRGSLRKSALIKENKICQIRAMVLKDVCYRLYAVVVNSDSQQFSEKSLKYKDINHAHSYQSQFNKRLKRGQNYRTPHLGWSEFLPTYVGIFRDNTHPCEDINITVPSVLFTCFDKLKEGNYDPAFVQNVKVNKGVVSYVK